MPVAMGSTSVFEAVHPDCGLIIIDAEYVLIAMDLVKLENLWNEGTITI